MEEHIIHQKKITGKKNRKSNSTVALNVLYAKKEEKVYSANVYSDTKILDFNQYFKSDKTPATIHVDFECLIRKR